MGLFGNLKQKYQEQKIASKQKKYAERQIRSKARAEYLRAKEDQSLRFAREKAKIEADRRLERYKQGGIIGGFMKQMTPKPMGKKRRKMTIPPNFFGSSQRTNDDWANIKW